MKRDFSQFTDEEISRIASKLEDLTRAIQSVGITVFENAPLGCAECGSIVYADPNGNATNQRYSLVLPATARGQSIDFSKIADPWQRAFMRFTVEELGAEGMSSDVTPEDCARIADERIDALRWDLTHG